MTRDGMDRFGFWMLVGAALLGAICGWFGLPVPPLGDR